MRNLLQDLNLVFDTFKNFPDLNQDRKIDFSDFKVGYETISDFTHHHHDELHIAHHILHNVVHDVQHNCHHQRVKHEDKSQNPSTDESEPCQDSSPTTTSGWIWHYDLENSWKYHKKHIYYNPVY